VASASKISKTLGSGDCGDASCDVVHFQVIWSVHLSLRLGIPMPWQSYHSALLSVPCPRRGDLHMGNPRRV